jgi:outer membrane protein assembly factor BamB
MTGSSGCVGRFRTTLNIHRHRSDAVLGEPPEPWPTLAHDARRTGARSEAVELGADPIIKRVAPAGTTTSTPPSVADESLFVPFEEQSDTDRTAFLAVGTDGDRRWEQSRRGSVTAPAVSGDTVVLTSANQTAAVDRRSGDIRWEYAPGVARGDPTLVDETVYIGADRLLALDAVTGERMWRSSDGPREAKRTAATEDTVFGADTDALYALRATDGSVRWRTPLRHGSTDTPVVGEESVFVATFSGAIYAFDREDGTERWSVALSSAYETAPAVAHGRVYLVTEDGAILALDTATGEEAWRTEIGTTVDHRPAVGGDSVYALAYSPHDIVVADAETGDVRRRRSLPSDTRGIAFETQGSLSLTDEAVYLIGRSADEGWGIYELGQQH